MKGYFTKENIIKIFVAVVVIAFLLEIFAFTPRSTPRPEAEEAKKTTAENASIGNAVVNATISSYARELTVFGSSEEFEAKASELRSQGRILYVSRLSDNRTLLNLASGETANKIAEEISVMNVQMLSAATLSFPSEIEFETSSGKKNASINGVLQMQLDPRIPVGANVSLGILANIENESVKEYSARIIPEEKTIQLTAKVKELTQEYKTVMIFSWENRNFNELELSQTLSQTRKLRYTIERIPVIMLSEPPSNESLEQLQNVSYVEKIKDNLVLVKSDFTNSTLLEEDFQTILGENVLIEFPPSRLNVSFSFNESNASAYLQEKLSPAQMIVLRKTVLTAPETIEIENSTYFVSSKEFNGFVFETTRENETALIDARIKIVANVVSGIEQTV